MTEFITSGRAIDVVIAVLVVEFLWLVARGQNVVAVACALVPGGLMVLSLRAAVTGQPWWWIVVPLAASLPVHLADLRRRGWF